MRNTKFEIVIHTKELKNGKVLYKAFNFSDLGYAQVFYNSLVSRGTKEKITVSLRTIEE